MFAGLGVVANQAPLTEEQEETFDEFFVFLSIAPSEYYAMPKDKREQVGSLMRSWHLNKLLMTRTASRKQ